MSAKTKRFIVVSVGDTGSAGYDEQGLALLLRLIESHSPDHRVFTHTGVVSHFHTSKKALTRVREIIAEVEALRVSDARFSDLKIGLAEGELVGDFDWLGRLKKDGVGLIGDAIVEAVREEKAPDACAQKLKLVAQGFHAQTA